MGASRTSPYSIPEGGGGTPLPLKPGLRLALPLSWSRSGTIVSNLTSVLLIDDDPAFRRLAARLLDGMGLSVVGEASTVESGVAAAQRLRPQAALVDVTLPDGSGVTLTGELAALPWRPRIVLTSNDSEAVSEAAARSAGAAAFIAKEELPGSRLGDLLAGRADPE